MRYHQQTNCFASAKRDAIIACVACIMHGYHITQVIRSLQWQHKDARDENNNIGVRVSSDKSGADKTPDPCFRLCCE